MNDIQDKVSKLQLKGWTLAAIADAVGLTVNAVEKWKAGDTYPRSSKAILLALDALLKKRPPKQRRYGGTHHLRQAKAERERESGDQTDKGQTSAGPDDRIGRTRRYWLSCHEPKFEGGTSLSVWDH